MFNFQTICSSNLLKDLSVRQRDVIARRFGLKGKRETLEAIGKVYGITRERVRQVEVDGFKRLAKKVSQPQCQNAFHYFSQDLKSSGSLKREDLLLAKLGGAKFKNHVLFLLTLGQPFQRVNETQELHTCWTVDKNSLNKAKKHISAFTAELKRKQKPLSLPSSIPVSYIEISKNILQGQEGLYGLKDWPEINPKGIKDKAFLALRKTQKPLHFTQVARLISRDALPQTVHNELIKDQRFVLVGRGLYALAEWGYAPGVVKEVIAQTIKQSKMPLRKEEVVKRVLQQRQVKPSTILLNLQNKQYFIKNSQDRYIIRKA